MKSSTYKPGAGVLMLVAYTAWYIMTPQYSSRFKDILEALQFEKIIAVATLIGILVQGRFPAIRYRLVVLILGLYLIMLASYFTSPYSYLPGCQSWFENHWKKLVFFLFLVCGLRSLSDLEFFMRWTAYVMLLYQLLSWRDFVSGGSYVYQQGIKRMCGAWSGGGVGAANGWASMNLFILPYSLWLYRSSETRRRKRVAAGAIALGYLSIIASGTRGAVIIAFAYGAVLLRRYVFRMSTAAAGVVVVALVLTLAPKSLVERYLSSLDVFAAKTDDFSKEQEIARKSAAGRIDGLIDGIALCMRRPVLGYGPEASAIARHEVRDIPIDLQLHNLLGQVMGELGFCGLFGFSCLLAVSLLDLASLRRAAQASGSETARLALALRTPVLQSILLYLVFGVFTHSVYDFRWLYALGCQVVLTSCYYQEEARARSEVFLSR
jgi:hypothetical protein